MVDLSNMRLVIVFSLELSSHTDGLYLKMGRITLNTHNTTLFFYLLVLNLIGARSLLVVVCLVAFSI